MAEEKPKTVTLTHPDAPQPITVAADEADAYIHGGWAPADNQPTK